MKKQSSVLLFFLILFAGNTSFSQTSESQAKLVIINAKEKRVAPLIPSFRITSLSFSDANKTMQIEDKELGEISFYIKNTGTVPLQELDINITDTEHTKGINYATALVIKQLNIGDSLHISIPFKTEEGIKNGFALFLINVTDIKSDSIQKAEIRIPTKETLYPPVFAWVNPALVIDKTDFPLFNISGLLISKSRLTGLNVIVNGQVLNNKNYTILPTDINNEYRISQTLALNEGDNEIKIEATNEQASSVSDPRVINYYVQKVDESYKEKRLALVIGNSEYINSNVLPNPVNDAKAIAQALTDVGFTVLQYFNANYRTMLKAQDDFGEKLKDYKVGLFYYAGHGVQVKGNNYLIPVDAALKVENDVMYDCIDAGRLLGKMEAAGTTTNIVILDACRNNPFERSWSGRNTGQGNGLAFMNAPTGSFIAYATAPGSTASDGTGTNGLYTSAILESIKIPNITISEMFQKVTSIVFTKSNKQQMPWVATNLMGNFYFILK